VSIRCIAVDDEPPALQLIKGYIERTPFLELVGVFHDPLKAIAAVKEHDIKLIFLDIHMPGLTGMQVSRLLPESCKVIFATAYEDYALESYRVAALDYLVKPYNFEEFSLAAKKAKDYFGLEFKGDKPHASGRANSEKNEFIFLKADYKLHKVYFSKILYIENIKDYVRIFFEDGSKLMVLMSLKSLEDMLPEGFMKVHRSFIVRLETVEVVERGRIVYGGVYVPVSDRYKEEFQQFLLS
jgi:DNA-binding LytR/AlgR family response regulator